jgi:ATP-dependent DNA helicase RecG
VAFRRLGLAVIDEQHRFGVAQRGLLSTKGTRPDVLVMTATPIPRSLALTLYGDLDVSVLDQLPPGRQPVRTAVRPAARRDRVLAFATEQMRQGRQVYVVYPVVEESEQADLRSATAGHEELRQGTWRGFEVGLLHGRMAGQEKAAIMAAFAAGRLQALVCTTVVEVGLDVPNAAVMIVEHAERFGLAQLHQLRGRVGRGGELAYCILLAHGDLEPGGVAAARLETLCATHDGFAIAQKDLELRGPGDGELLMLARREAERVVGAGA